MMQYKPGDIVLVKFPFTNLETTKQRPALVLHHTFHGSNIDFMGIAMVTSRIENYENYRLAGDVLIEHWKEAQLLYPSLVRLSKMASIDSSLIKQKLGKLKTNDMELVKKAFKQLFKHWI